MDVISMISIVATIVGAVAGVVAAVIGFLGLFFDVPKIRVSAGARDRFFCIAKGCGVIAIICIVVSVVTFFASTYAAEDVSGDDAAINAEEDETAQSTVTDSSQTDGDMEDDFNTEDIQEDESEPVTDARETQDTREEDTEDGSEASEWDYGGRDMLQIAPIAENAEYVEAIVGAFCQTAPVEILQISGQVSEEEQTDDYTYSAQVSGVHRFEFSEVLNGTDFCLKIYNSGWEQLKGGSDFDNGDGLTYSLTAGETYYIEVGQYRGFGPYTLNIGPQKQIEDITNYTSVADCIQYKDQENDYVFVASYDGNYRFEFSEVPHGTDLWLKIYNSGWEGLESGYDLDNGGGLTCWLEAGETYYISVGQYRGTGEYTLNVGGKKALRDVTNDTSITDSIQYKDQENDYLFVADYDGAYRFEFSDVPNGTDLCLKVYNSGWEGLWEDYDLDDGGGLTCSLTAGETYYIRVGYYRGFGAYTLQIGHKKETKDITNYTSLSDSIQYTAQENDYLFVAGEDGTYRFAFAGVAEGYVLQLKVYNSGWELQHSDYGLGSGQGIDILLSEGETCYIRVVHESGEGDYKLTIERLLDNVACFRGMACFPLQLVCA